MKSCQFCGNVINENSNYCNSCGAKQASNLDSGCKSNDTVNIKSENSVQNSENTTVSTKQDYYIAIVSLIFMVIWVIMIFRIGLLKTIGEAIGVILVYGIIAALLEGVTKKANTSCNISITLVAIICIPLFINQLSNASSDTSLTNSDTSLTNSDTNLSKNNSQYNVASAPKSSSEVQNGSKAIEKVINQYGDAMSNCDAKKLYGIIYGEKIAKMFHFEDISEGKWEINSFNQKLKDQGGMTSSDSKYAFQITKMTKLSNEEMNTIASTYKFVYELLDVKSDINITDGYAVTTAVRFNNVPAGTHVFNVIKLNNDWKIDCSTSLVGGGLF